MTIKIEITAEKISELHDQLRGLLAGTAAQLTVAATPPATSTRSKKTTPAAGPAPVQAYEAEQSPVEAVPATGGKDVDDEVFDEPADLTDRTVSYPDLQRIMIKLTRVSNDKTKARSILNEFDVAHGAELTDVQRVRAYDKAEKLIAEYEAA